MITVKFYSWNVNGYRACIRHGFYEFMDKYKPDIIGIQEIKQSDKPLAPPGYYMVWNPAKRKGYAGNAIFVKEEFGLKDDKSILGIGNPIFDDEGRVSTLECDNFYFVNAYFPNSQHELKRLDFKLEFDKSFSSFVNKLRKKKPVIMCGDFNVAHEEIDIARPKGNEHNPGFTKEERDWMTKLLSDEYLDTFRFLHPKEVKYSWWSYRFNARKRNIGWRIDYFVVSKGFENKMKTAKADILTEVLGSDHAPIYLEIDV